MAEEYDEAFGYEWYSRKWTAILSNPAAQYESHLFSLVCHRPHRVAGSYQTGFRATKQILEDQIY